MKLNMKKLTSEDKARAEKVRQLVERFLSDLDGMPTEEVFTVLSMTAGKVVLGTVKTEEAKNDIIIKLAETIADVAHGHTEREIEEAQARDIWKS